jgi:hypothetical protein
LKSAEAHSAKAESGDPERIKARRNFVLDSRLRGSERKKL